MAITIQDKVGLTCDNVPTANSDNAVKSGGVYAQLQTKQDAESGKGLSTNDYTTAEKQKLAALPTNADLQTALNGKQAAGSYAQNGGGSNNWRGNANGSYIGKFESGGDGLTKGIRLWGEYAKESTGYNCDSLLFSRAGGQIAHQVYNADTSAWEVKAIYTADEDTGWQTLGDSSAEVQYRKKNGIVFVRGENTTQALTEDVLRFGDLPTGFKPSKIVRFAGLNGNQSAMIGGYVTESGTVAVRTLFGASGTTGYHFTVSFPV